MTALLSIAAFLVSVPIFVVGVMNGEVTTVFFGSLLIAASVFFYSLRKQKVSRDMADLAAQATIGRGPIPDDRMRRESLLLPCPPRKASKPMNDFPRNELTACPYATSHNRGR